MWGEMKPVDQRFWDDVEAGDEVEGYDLPLTPTQWTLHVSGSQDWNIIHHNAEVAKSLGHPDMFVNTGFMTACFGRLLTQYIGYSGRIKKFRMEMRRPNLPGDTMMLRGKVTGKSFDGTDHVVDLELWCENPRIGVTTPTVATVALPKK